MAISLDKILAQHAYHHPLQPAVSFNDEHFNYQQWHQKVDEIALALDQLGLSKGDKLTLILPNCVELLALYWACARLGVVVVPLSPLLQDQAAINLCLDADSECLICVDVRQPKLADMCPQQLRILSLQDLQSLLMEVAGEQLPKTKVTSDDLFNIVYSSGTTGLPKGIMHTHGIRAMYGYSFTQAFGFGRQSVALHTGSMVFNGAFVTMLPCVLNGGHFVFTPAFDVQTVIELTKRHGVTHTMMVPSQIISLLDNPEFDAQTLPSLAMILVLGAPLQLHYKQLLQARFPGRFFELYGLTEGFITVLDNADAAANPKSVGCPIAGSQMRIVDSQGEDLPAGEVGEIVGNGPLLSPGYYGNPELTAQTFKEGWLYTGDLGYQDDKGFLYLVDRQKDLIISGGVNVYPSDIEEVMVTHPAIQEVAVIGVAHERWGETPIAVVVLKEEAQGDQEPLAEQEPLAGQEPLAEKILQWTNARVAARYQKLSAVQVIASMPRNVAGKTLKQELRQRFAKHT